MNRISSARKQATRLLEIDQTLPVSVRIPVGSAVHCITGQVWLTQEGLPDDVVLAAGEKFVARQKGLIVMNAIRGAALVYLSASTRERADDAVILTPDFPDAARARAAELRREEMSRLAGVAWGFVMQLLQRTKALWKNERPTFLRACNSQVLPNFQSASPVVAAWAGEGRVSSLPVRPSIRRRS